MAEAKESTKTEPTEPTEPKPTEPQKEPERTFTQAEFDKALGERLKNERKRHADELAKFSDYEDMKAKAAKFDELDEANKSELQKANEAAQAAQKRAEEAESRLAALTAKAEHDALVQKVAREQDVDAWLLQGETEEELEEFARRIKALEESRKPKPPADQGGAPAFNGSRGSNLSEREEHAFRIR